MLYLAVLLGLLLCTIPQGNAVPTGVTVLGIDFGDKNVKVAGIQPRKADAIQIVINDLSERMTPNQIGLRNQRTLFGSQSDKVRSSRPETYYEMIQSVLLGQPFQSPSVQRYMALFKSELAPDDKRGGTVLVKDFNGDWVAVEYLVAKFLVYLVEQSEIYLERLVSAVVFAVPPSFNQSQRQALLDAAGIAGIKVLAIVNDISAAALYYGMQVLNPPALSTADAGENGAKTESANKQLHLIIDSGASGTSVGVFEVDFAAQVKGQASRAVRAKAIVTDSKLSGHEMDRRVVKILAEKFASEKPQAAKNGFAPGRPYNGLLMEARRVKHILSANQEIMANVEYGDEMVHTIRMRRSDIEAASMDDLQPIVSALLERVLSEAKVSMDQISSVVPIGGNVRVPFIQAAIKAFAESKYQQTLNGDETVAKGAALYAASLHTSLQMKPFGFTDVRTASVELSYQNYVDGQLDPTNSHVVVLPTFSSFNTNKGVAFKNVEGAEFTVLEHSADTKQTMTELFKGKISGMGKVLANYANAEIISSKLKMWVNIDLYGMVSLGESKVIVQYLKKTTEEPASEQRNTAEGKKENEEEKILTDTVDATFSSTILWSPMETENKQEYKRKIDVEKEAVRLQKEHAKVHNDLESSIFRIREHIHDADYRKWFREAEIENVSQVLHQVEDHMHKALDPLTTADLLDLLKKLQDAEAPSLRRKTALKDIESGAQKLREIGGEVEAWMGKTRKIPAEDRGATDEDLAKLSSRLQESLADIPQLLTQSREGVLDDAKLNTVEADLKGRLGGIREEFVYLKLKRPPPKPQPVEVKDVEEQPPTSDKSPDNGQEKNSQEQPNAAEIEEMLNKLKELNDQREATYQQAQQVQTPESSAIKDGEDGDLYHQDL